MKLMIADDERFEREFLAEIVTGQFPHQVQIRMVENGRQAVETAVLWMPDIVLMDIEMPGINGIEAAKRILAQMPDCKLIFVTAFSLFNYAYEAVKMGAYDYILKPVNPEDVARSVQRCIDQIETEHQLKAMAPVAESLAESASYDKTTMLMDNVKTYLQHNYMLLWKSGQGERSASGSIPTASWGMRSAYISRSSSAALTSPGSPPEPWRNSYRRPSCFNCPICSRTPAICGGCWTGRSGRN